MLLEALRRKDHEPATEGGDVSLSCQIQTPSGKPITRIFGSRNTARGIVFPQTFLFLGKLHPGEEEHEMGMKETKQKGINCTPGT